MLSEQGEVASGRIQRVNEADAWLQAQRSRVTVGFAAEGNFGRTLGRRGGEHKANVNLNSTARALNQGRRDVIEGSGSWSDARRRGVEVAQRWRRNRLFGSLRERAWQPGIER